MVIGLQQQKRIEIVMGGSPFFNELLHQIEAAASVIQLQTYIFLDDDTGRTIANALIKAASRGVLVYVLVDGYASRTLGFSLAGKMKAAGIQFRFFKAMFSGTDFYIGRRLHHKIAVFDSKFALVGGINIADRYNEMDGIQPWLDFAILVEGPLAKEVCVLCSKTWNGYSPNFKPLPCSSETSFELSTVAARLRRNDWLRGKVQISSSYLTICKQANKQIFILCSYFLPGRVIRSALSAAVKRGVRVKVIVGGFSDVPFSKAAERFWYDWMLRNNIEIFEYQPNVLHGKVAVMDDSFFTIGSYNVNDISAHASIEANIDVLSADLAKQWNSIFDSIIQRDCSAITIDHPLQKVNPLQQFFRWFSYELIRVVLYLFTFYFKRSR